MSKHLVKTLALTAVIAAGSSACPPAMAADAAETASKAGYLNKAYESVVQAQNALEQNNSADTIKALSDASADIQKAQTKANRDAVHKLRGEIAAVSKSLNAKGDPKQAQAKIMTIQEQLKKLTGDAPAKS